MIDEERWVWSLTGRSTVRLSGSGELELESKSGLLMGGEAGCLEPEAWCFGKQQATWRQKQSAYGWKQEASSKSTLLRSGRNLLGAFGGPLLANSNPLLAKSSLPGRGSQVLLGRGQVLLVQR